MGMLYDGGEYTAMFLSKRMEEADYTAFKALNISDASGITTPLAPTVTTVGLDKFLDYRIVFNYVNNFNHTNKVFSCDKRTSFTLNYVSIDARDVNKTNTRYYTSQVVNGQGGKTFPAPGAPTHRISSLTRAFTVAFPNRNLLC